jgi:hypothetical protein
MMSGACSESANYGATPKFYKLMQPQAPHPTRHNARQLPPEQHSWFGQTHYVQGHVWPPHNITVPYPNGPGPLVVYYSPRVAIVDAQGDPVLDGQGMPTYQAQPAIRRAEQATIGARFKRTKNYWELYPNMQRAVFNCLDTGINDAFKVSNNPAFTGWNPSMEPREMFDQITATYRRPTPAALLQNDTLF